MSKQLTQAHQNLVEQAKRTIECQCCCSEIQEGLYCVVCEHNWELLEKHYKNDNPSEFEQQNQLRECPGNNCGWWPLRF